MNVLDLFSGIGGFSLGLERAGMHTIAFCEIEEKPRQWLRRHWPGVPIFEDVRELHATDISEPVDIICGGYPCQPFSVAGQRRGQEDDRHLWPEIMRLIRELDATTGKPTWCIFENVAGHVSMGLDEVLSDLESEDYTCWPVIIPACALNAPHRRDRVWIVANSNNQRPQRRSKLGKQKKERQAKAFGGQNSTGCAGKNVADATCNLFDRSGDARPAGRNEPANGGVAVANPQGEQAGRIFEPWFSPHPESSCDWRGKTEEWTTEPPVCGPDDGVPDRVDRLKASGNAVVPQIPELLGRVIIECG